MESLRPILQAHPFFEGMKPEHLDILVGCTSNAQFGKDKFIFRAGEQADHFYLIRHGHVELDLAQPGQEPITILSLGDGEVLGWSWMVPPYKWKFDARATERTRALRLNGRCLREKWQKDHELGFDLLRRFADISGQRLEAANRALIGLRETQVNQEYQE